MAGMRLHAACCPFPPQNQEAFRSHPTKRATWLTYVIELCAITTYVTFIYMLTEQQGPEYCLQNRTGPGSTLNVQNAIITFDQQCSGDHALAMVVAGRHVPGHLSAPGNSSAAYCYHAIAAELLVHLHHNTHLLSCPCDLSFEHND